MRPLIALLIKVSCLIALLIKVSCLLRHARRCDLRFCGTAQLTQRRVERGGARGRCGVQGHERRSGRHVALERRAAAGELSTGRVFPTGEGQLPLMTSDCH